MFIAGTDTTSVTVEWAMAELLRKPAVIRKAQAELDEIVGQAKRMEESDIAKLPYLQAIVKEALRLHPAAPLIIPRRSDNSCEIGGYLVPENTQVFVNVWGIGRDPSVWKEPLEFNPERFLECNTDYRGQDFELIPFGAGRRICIGLPLAHRMVHLVLGSLLHAFNWSIPGATKDDDFVVDMSEVFGLTLQKRVPLIAVPTPRQPINLLY
jgi:cytochrome P450